MGIIYKHTIKNKSYIGYTKYSLEHRLNQHFIKIDKGIKSKFYNYVRKYGKDLLESEIIEHIPDKLLQEREKFWIEYYDTFNNGLNLTKGGGRGPIRLGHKNSPEHRHKSSQTQKGRKKKTGNKCGKYKKSEEHKKKLSNSVSGYVWVSNHSETIQINPNKLSYYIDKGYVKGRRHLTKNPVTGPLSEKHKENIRKAMQRPLVKCEYCEYIGKDFAVTRWHNENCKNINNSNNLKVSN